MRRSFPIGRALAGLFVVINIAGAISAIVDGNAMHACVHLVLLVPGTYLLWRLMARRAASESRVELPADVSDFVERVRRLEQSIHSVAIEMERVGEGQRYTMRLLTDKDAVPVPGGDATSARAR